MVIAVDGERDDIRTGHAGMDLNPVLAVVGRTKDITAVRAGEEETDGADVQGKDLSTGEAGIDRGPVLAIIGGAKDAAGFGAGEEGAVVPHPLVVHAAEARVLQDLRLVAGASRQGTDSL